MSNDLRQSRTSAVVVGWIALWLATAVANAESIFDNGRPVPPASTQAPVAAGPQKPPSPNAGNAPVVLPAPAVPTADLDPTDKLPTREAVRAAQLIIKDAFQNDYKRVDARGRHDLLEKMRVQANDPKNEPAVQYAILLDAGNVATSAGDSQAVIWVSDELAKRYPHASMEVRLTILGDAARSIRTADATRDLVEALVALSDDAAWAGDFATALHAAEQAQALHSAAAGLEKVRIFGELVSTSEAVKQGLNDSRSAKDSARLGLFYCFGNDQWELGRPMLIKGDDPPLAALAAKDVAGAAGSEDAVALADSYMEIAKTRGRSALIRNGAAGRAAWWYGKALPNAGGLQKVYVEKKLAEARRLSVWVTRATATDRLRTAILTSTWGWSGPDVQMTFRDDGSVGHRGMHGTWKITSPRDVLIFISNGDIMDLRFNAALSHYTSLGRGFGGDRAGG